MNAMSDEQALNEPWARMMRAAIAGDEGAYRRLLEEIGRSVRAMARGAFSRARVGDADIEDVVQETLLAIHLKRHTWDSGQRLAPWVSAIARHKIIDAMRRRGARRVEPIEDFEAVLAAPETEDPHDISDAQRLMEKLQPRQRDIVRSISLEGQSIAATAVRLSMTEVAVRVALHRALKALAEAWRTSIQ
jgi:RNA polymerase sigma-70 factor (ECF subfamily)